MQGWNPEASAATAPMTCAPVAAKVVGAWLSEGWGLGDFLGHLGFRVEGLGFRFQGLGFRI